MRTVFFTFTVLCGIARLGAFPVEMMAGEIKDAESATHGGEAASYQVVDTYEFPGLKIIQFDLAVLSHYSYLLVSGGECLVVDPGRDVFSYLEAAKKEGAKITGVWLTHSHADFVAGHVELAKRLGVPLHISEKAGAGYPHVALKDNDTLVIGDAVLRLLETPGHTPDSMCGLVAGKQSPERPLAVFTGDTLFIGSVGRPDLLGENMSASMLASMMFDTWTNKLSKLPDEVMILPAHGAGSLCGAHLSDEPVSTLGQQRVSNPYLQHKSRGQFIAAILEGLPDAPQYFSHNAAMNRQGPEAVDWSPEALPHIQPSVELTDPAGYYVVDVRGADEYAAGHIPNSVNIALRGRFETWTGIMVPWDAKVVLTGSVEQIQEALYRLHRVGYRPQCLAFDAWKQAGLPLTRNEMITPRELHAQMQTPDSPIVVDVRLPSEWMALRIGTVVNLPLSELSGKAGKLDRSQRIVAVCNSAYRSSLAVGVFERAGFRHVSSMAGGGQAWIKAGLPVLEAHPAGAVSKAPKREIHLAERISAAELKRLVMDLPGTFQLVDVRPPEHFADYSLLAMMVAGILSQKTQRSIKALFGGLEAYWNEAGPGAGARPVGGAPAGEMVPRRPAAAPPAGAPVRTSRRKKSAGC
ncbi:MAG: rhodanese-like domain-containing protein [Planctomycetota bacterium]|jgi:glyoxylase-like metal-dependent hydrolase (beta-lactamase superfamily II)/rhodanese-related sulfurtransferase